MLSYSYSYKAKSKSPLLSKQFGVDTFWLIFLKSTFGCIDSLYCFSTPYSIYLCSNIYNFLPNIFWFNWLFFFLVPQGVNLGCWFEIFFLKMFTVIISFLALFTLHPITLDMLCHLKVFYNFSCEFFFDLLFT